MLPTSLNTQISQHCLTLSTIRLILDQSISTKVVIIFHPEHSLGEWDFVSVRVLAGNWDRKYPNGSRRLVVLWKINKRCRSFPRAVKSRGGGITSMSSSRPEGAKPLLDPERLIATVVEKEILVGKHSHSWPADFIKSDCCLLPPSSCQGLGNQSVREPGWLSPWKSAWGQAVQRRVEMGAQTNWYEWKKNILWKENKFKTTYHEFHSDDSSYIGIIVSVLYNYLNSPYIETDIHV